jgi:hypothetical protein
VSVDENEAKALEGRRRGLPFAAIAQALGIDEMEAEKAFMNALDGEAPDLDPETMRRLDASRLDRMTQGLWGAASSGNARAVEMMLRVMDARARLIAVPAPSALVDSYEETIRGLHLTDADSALVSAGRRLCERIDAAGGSLDPSAETKSMYLVPHLTNVLRELGATAAARAAVELTVKAPKEAQGGGKLAQLRALRDGEASGNAASA